MIESMTACDVEKRLQTGELRLVDVRDPAEYEAVSIPGARLIPLSVIDSQDVLDAGAQQKMVAFFCRSGNRTRNAAARLERAALRAGVQGVILEGGISAWEKARLPIAKGEPLFPIFRQIQIGAGLLVLLGLAGSALWGPMIWLSGFVGAGLVFAGVSGFCGLGFVLGLMPWNRRKSGV